MCGVVGLFGRFSQADDPVRLVGKMAGLLKHRGPDDWGVWSDPDADIALGHTRLSIIDLSQAGHQPMESACGRYMISFNGEIYNFKSLRSELSALGRAFRGNSDTEVLLAAVSEWGLSRALEKLVGMFAFALWDRHSKRLHFARDRFGEKPLYYAKVGKGIAFASELKSFQAVPGFQCRVSRSSLALLLRFNYIPSPHCIYENAHKVNPGEMLTFALRHEAAELLERKRFWDLEAVARKGRENPFPGGFQDAVASLKTLLSDSVERQMVADVPLGAFLSGGIDSSLVTSIMQSLSSRKVKTFSIGFEWEGFNEAEHAKQVAGHLGTDHEEFYVTTSDATAVIPRLPDLYDEPFADSSQIPTFILCQMARKEVTVALTGDGADELFFGYNRYFRGMQIWPYLGGIPGGARRMLQAVASGARKWQPMERFLDAGILPGPLRNGCENLRRRAQYALELCGSMGPGEFYRNLVSQERRPEAMMEGGFANPDSAPEGFSLPRFPGFQDLMMYYDSMQYLPDDILVKVDRASMGVGLETRVPFLDHRLCEFAWSLPFDFKYREKTGGKRILKQLLSEYLPGEFIDRPKSGFGVPLDQWLRGPLRPWAESLLDEGALREEGFLRPEAVRRKWSQFIQGRSKLAAPLWGILMFQSWLGSSGQGLSEQGRLEPVYADAKGEGHGIPRE